MEEPLRDALLTLNVLRLICVAIFHSHGISYSEITKQGQCSEITISIPKEKATDVKGQ